MSPALMSTYLLGAGAIGATGRAIIFVVDVVRRLGKVRCQGKLVDHEAYETTLRRGGPVTYYKPIFEFQGPDGKTRRVVGDVGYPEPKPAIERPVYFDPKDDSKTYVDLFTEQKLRVTLIPIVLLAVGGALWFYSHR